MTTLGLRDLAFLGGLGGATDPNTLLLISGRGANGSTAIVDSSMYARAITVNGNAQITTSVADPFGATEGVITLDGNGDWLQIAASADMALGSNDFTVETFVRFSALNGFTTVSRLGSGNSADGVLFAHGSPSKNYATIDGWNWQVIQSITGITANTWVHLAFSRSGNTWRSFVAGQVVATTSESRGLVQATPYTWRVGAANSDGSFAMAGQLAQFRVSLGARYTANFTPPTAPFPN